MILLKTLMNLNKLHEIKKSVSSLEIEFSNNKTDLQKIQALEKSLDKALMAVVFDLGDRLNNSIFKEDLDKITYDQISFWLSDSLHILKTMENQVEVAKSLKTIVLDLKDFFSKEYRSFAKLITFSDELAELIIIKQKVAFLIAERFGQNKSSKEVATT
jgi:thymidine kinase